jgi:TetR/AcrR family transcriptional repressor of nem operon
MAKQKTTKEEIIKQSVEVFRKQGYYKTSMSDLAKACGLLKGSFYYHFASKEELMQAVLESVHRYYTNKVFCIAYEEGKTARERFIQLFEKQAPILTEDLAGCMFGNMTLETISSNPEFKKLLQQFFDDWTAAFQHIFEENYTSEKAKELAQQSVIEVEGAIMMMRLYDDKKIFEQACLHILDKL